MEVKTALDQTMGYCLPEGGDELETEIYSFIYEKYHSSCLELIFPWVQHHCCVQTVFPDS